MKFSLINSVDLKESEIKRFRIGYSRPFQTFDKKLLYPSVVEQAAALAESLITNHPFQDGNKRIGYTMMRLHLMMNHMDIEATEDEKYDFVIKIASGDSSFEEIKKWIKDKLKNEG